MQTCYLIYKCLDCSEAASAAVHLRACRLHIIIRNKIWRRIYLFITAFSVNVWNSPISIINRSCSAAASRTFCSYSFTNERHNVSRVHKYVMWFMWLFLVTC